MQSDRPHNFASCVFLRTTTRLACWSQAVRNEVVAADAVFLQREVERLTEALAEACTGAAESASLRAELAAATAAGSHLAEELATAESAARQTQARPCAWCHARGCLRLCRYSWAPTTDIHPAGDVLISRSAKHRLTGFAATYCGPNQTLSVTQV